MTINALHRLLGTLIVCGHGRRDVYVDKDTFRDNRESDGVTIMPVMSADILCYPVADDDGGIATNKDGTERQFTSLVLMGWE